MNSKLQPPLDGLHFSELRQPAGLKTLDERFLARLSERDSALAERLRAYRRPETNLTPKETSELLLAVAPHLDVYLCELFGIRGAEEAAEELIRKQDPVLRFKKEFVQRRVRRHKKPVEAAFSDLDGWLDEQLAAANTRLDDRELAISLFADHLLTDKDAHAEAIEKLTKWCKLARKQETGPGGAVAGWASFHIPQKTDHANLVPLEKVTPDTLQASPERWRRRDGFELTDQRMSEREIMGEIDYCIYCHDHEGDFCSIGFPEKKAQPELGLKQDPLDNTLTGCPLDEKISEMHVLKRDGYSIGALSMTMVENPMVPATGHRICNDCMKSCIYQKQDPVDIPQVETGILTDVLHLPWGVEIYDLLTRWNPLRREQYVMQPYNGRKVLVAGMGPAGFTMAHHLTMAGCAVVGIDGLKIEPLPSSLVDKPIRDYSSLEEPLDDRILLGFGGVAEYGITVRWDKNFLKLIYLVLARRATFQVAGGVRLGGTLTLEDAWDLGFDHVTMATGAGLPRVINIGNSLARGMRQASDFLMALQLTGAAKENSLANLQVRLPAVIIGGGLTGVDTATEVQAYYIKQVEKTLNRYEQLAGKRGEDWVRKGLWEEDREILDEFLAHGREVRKERERAATAGETPDFIPLLHAWGGVTIAYRKSINASPAYVRNHEEVIKATEEGLFYAEGLNPIHGELDRFGHVKDVIFRRMRWEEGRWLATQEEVTLPAKAVFVAAGTVPNTIYEREHPGTLNQEGTHFQPHVHHAGNLQPMETAEHCKSKEFGPFTSYKKLDHLVTFVGDTHPVFHGSVVKAIASSQRAYKPLLETLKQRPPVPAEWSEYTAFRDHISDLLSARVVAVDSSNPGVTELWVRAPMAVKKFRPGQFFRLQSFESLSPVMAGTRLQIPLLTVSGTGIQDDMVRLLVFQGSAPTRMVERLQPGEPVVLMGPTGHATDLHEGRQTVMVIAGRWGAAVMLDVGRALKEAGNRVLYVGAYPSAAHVDKQDEMERAADQIIWCTASEPVVKANRPQDTSVIATDLVALVRKYGDGEIGPADSGTIPLSQVDRVMVMGGAGLLGGFQQALAGDLSPYFPEHLQAEGTVGSPMQCMLKGVCSQCLQWQIDPDTGERTRAVFSCAEQEQPLAWIDLNNLRDRQMQNRLPDMLAAKWVEEMIPPMEEENRERTA